MKFIKDNLVVFVQLLIFALGVILIWIDGSGGYISNMTWLSAVGVTLLPIAIAFQYILSGVASLFKKKE